jgi:hypothetical protein
MVALQAGRGLRYGDFMACHKIAKPQWNQLFTTPPASGSRNGRRRVFYAFQSGDDLAE